MNYLDMRRHLQMFCVKPYTPQYGRAAEALLQVLDALEPLDLPGHVCVGDSLEFDPKRMFVGGFDKYMGNTRCLWFAEARIGRDLAGCIPGTRPMRKIETESVAELIDWLKTEISKGEEALRDD